LYQRSLSPSIDDEVRQRCKLPPIYSPREVAFAAAEASASSGCVVKVATGTVTATARPPPPPAPSPSTPAPAQAAPLRNAFDLMRPAADPLAWAALYEWVLDKISPEHPLYNSTYIGQVCRVGKTPEQAFEVRTQRHLYDSVSDPKEVGLHAAITSFGADAFTVRLIPGERKHAPRPQAMKWANEREIVLIAERGGVLRDMEPEEPLHQTLNLTAGGQGDAVSRWKSIQARSEFTWRKAKAALLQAVDVLGTSKVPQGWIHPTSGHKTWQLVNSIRMGAHWRDKPDAANRRLFLEGLAGWTWARTLDNVWEDAKIALLAAVSVLGTAKVPSTWVHQTSGHKTGQLVINIRNKGEHLHGKPDEAERRLFLEGLVGWTWAPYDDAWEAAKIALSAAIDKTGSVNLAQKWVHPETGHKTGMLVNNIKNSGSHWRGKPDEAERILFLETLPGWTWGETRDDAWEAAKTALCQAVDKTGSVQVADRWVNPVTGHKTGILVRNIRHNGRHWRGKPDEASRREWLESLSGWRW